MVTSTSCNWQISSWWASKNLPTTYHSELKAIHSRRVKCWTQSFCIRQVSSVSIIFTLLVTLRSCSKSRQFIISIYYMRVLLCKFKNNQTILYHIKQSRSNWRLLIYLSAYFFSNWQELYRYWIIKFTLIWMQSLHKMNEQ